MNLFLTPEGYPFFAGTNFFKTRYTSKTRFLNSCKKYRKAWETNQKSLIIQGENIINEIKI